MVIGLLVSRHRAKERDLSDLRYSLELFYPNEEGVYLCYEALKRLVQDLGAKRT
jgi:hypothetical protein